MQPGRGVARDGLGEEPTGWRDLVLAWNEPSAAGRSARRARRTRASACARPRHRCGLALRGEAHLELGDFERAAAAFESAVQRDVDSWHSRLGLAALYEDDGRLEDARDQLEHLVELDGEHPTPLFRLARVERALGLDARADETERHHRRAAILDDMRMRGGMHSDVQKHLAVATHLVAQGRPGDALPEFQGVLAKSDDPRYREPATAGIRTCEEKLALRSGGSAGPVER